MIEALKKVAGAKAAERVVFKPDARIQAIVKTWPVFRTPRALAMGFKADADVESIIRAYIADEGIRSDHQSGSQMRHQDDSALGPARNQSLSGKLRRMTRSASSRRSFSPSAS
jgi:hypothetical protein